LRYGEETQCFFSAPTAIARFILGEFNRALYLFLKAYLTPQTLSRINTANKVFTAPFQTELNLFLLDNNAVTIQK